MVYLILIVDNNKLGACYDKLRDKLRAAVKIGGSQVKG